MVNEQKIVSKIIQELKPNRSTLEIKISSRTLAINIKIRDDKKILFVFEGALHNFTKY